jgi:hypothetical protein
MSKVNFIQSLFRRDGYYSPTETKIRALNKLEPKLGLKVNIVEPISICCSNIQGSEYWLKPKDTICIGADVKNSTRMVQVLTHELAHHLWHRKGKTKVSESDKKLFLDLCKQEHLKDPNEHFASLAEFIVHGSAARWDEKSKYETVHIRAEKFTAKKYPEAWVIEEQRRKKRGESMKGISPDEVIFMKILSDTYTKSRVGASIVAQYFKKLV